VSQGSYRIEAETTARRIELSSATPGLLSGLLLGISDRLADEPEMLVSLVVEHQPDVPATPLGGRVEAPR
jgi:hypothetical protein